MKVYEDYVKGDSVMYIGTDPLLHRHYVRGDCYEVVGEVNGNGDSKTCLVLNKVDKPMELYMTEIVLSDSISCIGVLT